MLHTFIYFLLVKNLTTSSADMVLPSRQELIPMVNELLMGCPECSMAYGMNSALSKSENEYRCTANPAHKFRLGPDGFLKSL